MVSEIVGFLAVRTTLSASRGSIMVFAIATIFAICAPVSSIR